MVYMYHSFLVYSSADGHLGCFHVLAMTNSAAMNIGVHVSLSEHSFLIVLGLCCCTQAFSSLVRRLLFTAAHRLLTAVASLVSKLRL